MGCHSSRTDSDTSNDEVSGYYEAAAIPRDIEHLIEEEFCRVRCYLKLAELNAQINNDDLLHCQCCIVEGELHDQEELLVSLESHDQLVEVCIATHTRNV